MNELVGLIVLAGIGYAVAIASKGVIRRQRLLQLQQQAWANHQARLHNQQLEAERKRREQNERGKWLQISLQQLAQAPDFQRALSWALKCQEINLPFRQRQFRRFRGELVAHLSRRLAAGENRERLMTGLRGLVKALGIAPFEADYMLRQVQERQQSQSDPAGQFAAQLRRQQQEHDQRMSTLRSLNVSDDIREQLLEAEERRFQQQLFGRQGA